MGGDIHDFQQRLRRAFDSLARSPISERNKDLIRAFARHCFASGLKPPRIEKYVRTLRLIAERYLDGRNFDELTRDEMEGVVAEIEMGDYEAWTKHDYEVTLKVFYKWLGREDLVSWIKPKKPRKEKLPDELLREDEIKRLVEAAHSARDKALVATLYESGARISEIGNLRIKDVQFDDLGAVVVVRGKTGARRIRLVFAVPYLARWLEEHPRAGDPEAPLWVTNRGGMMKYRAIYTQLQKIARRARVRKKVNPHNFRHSRATEMAKHITEAQMNQLFGWVQGSRMPSVYVHLSGRDLDEDLLRLYGIEAPRREERAKLEIVQCWRCGAVNSPTAKLCRNCKTPLKAEYADELDKKLREFLIRFFELARENPEVLEQVVERLRAS